MALKLAWRCQMKCEACEGRRVVFGFGGMKHPCTKCANPVKSDIKIDKRTKQFRDDKKEA